MNTPRFSNLQGDQLREGIAALSEIFPCRVWASESWHQEQKSLFAVLMHYGEILLSWQQCFPLLGTCREDEFVPLHLLDSLSGAFFLTQLFTEEGGGPVPIRIVDVGSGLGLPGIPLGIGLRESLISLVEVSRKKASILRSIIWELGLGKRAEVCENSIAEMDSASWQGGFRIITCRAFKVLDKRTWRLLRQPIGVSMPGQLGGILLYKGLEKNASSELRNLGLVPSRLHRFILPFCRRERTLIWFSPSALIGEKGFKGSEM